MAILPRLASPYVGSLSPPPERKDGGVGTKREFRPASWGKARIDLDFLDPPYPVPSHVDKGKIVIFSYPKTLLFKQTYLQFILFYPTWLFTSFFSIARLEIGYQF